MPSNLARFPWARYTKAKLVSFRHCLYTVSADTTLGRFGVFWLVYDLAARIFRKKWSALAQIEYIWVPFRLNKISDQNYRLADF